MRRTTTNNEIQLFHIAGSTVKSVKDTTITDTNYHCWAITWNVSGDAVKAYVDGSQSGATQTGLGTWVGNLGATNTCVGASNQTPDEVWSGDIGPVALWNTPLTADQIAYLAKP